MDALLQRLGVDDMDLYQIHRWVSRTPIEETLEGAFIPAATTPARRSRQSRQTSQQYNFDTRRIRCGEGASRQGGALAAWSCWHTLGKKSKNCEMSAWQPNQPPAG
jgi:hypothetical protein